MMFWPLPEHLLADAFERYTATKNADEVLQLPYWTSSYVHLGAFRITQFDPGQGVTLEANERYFLGRPRIDTVRVSVFNDQNTLLASVLAGTVDLVPGLALREAAGVPLRDAWRSSGAGTGLCADRPHPSPTAAVASDSPVRAGELSNATCVRLSTMPSTATSSRTR